MRSINQTPEQAARDKIDTMLEQAGWKVQSKKKIDFNAGLGIAVREYQTDIGPADYVLFVDKKPVGVVEAKPQERRHNITTVEEQTGSYASARLKWLNNTEPLPFIYESTGVLTRFTNGWDLKPRSRELFSFPQPEMLLSWYSHVSSLRKRWEIQDEDLIYSDNELDRAVVNPDPIRTVVRTFREKWRDIFPGRVEVPKTLVFAKAMAQNFQDYLEYHRDEIEALTIFYAQPHRRRELTYAMIRDVLNRLKHDRPHLSPLASLAGLFPAR